MVAAVAGLPPGRSGSSLWRRSMIAGPSAVVAPAAGGWVVGLPGTLGHGAIKVGWVTRGSTLLLAVALVVNRPGSSPVPGRLFEPDPAETSAMAGQEDYRSWAAKTAAE
ncbi:hypothetical protein [Paractinoplanes globisporus]|uniref:Uncharacterized protein n=1 Tax=Paractinoplanes globisporus TaxID=113565 RepID=A0ABW6WS34_9ACTN|nr:hypothetical protein [Actinoplanes globisporus]